MPCLGALDPVIQDRLAKLGEWLKKLGLPRPNILISSPENRRFFSGFTPTDPGIAESSGSLLITPRRRCILSDPRFTLAAKEDSPGFEFILYGGSLGRAIAQKFSLSSVLWYEPKYLTVSGLMDLAQNLRVDLEPLPKDLSDLRLAKTDSELTLIKKALAITEEAMGRLWENLAPGWTEGQAALFLDSAFRELGASGSAFETIVASGPRAALPHAEPGDKVIKKGELVVIDCGARYQGYAADITRTFAAGSLKDWQKKIYRVVREAQVKALEALGPGRTGAQVDKVARDHIAEAGYGDYFGHSLGHGVGLAVHEGPSLSLRETRQLPVGAVVTIEPGIYLPDQGGVRLEQMAVITEDGHELLNHDRHFYDF
ncbi:MAG: aminopeptidase P family protein [Deltaproteobacteria bacterium]|jgi:Xaa-Pro aminopeptidase|nr:aminopeptidase P family protein [Deltaproteobacteria bacterium]